MGGGIPRQDPMIGVVIQLGQHLQEQLLWFNNFGAIALQNNRIEYAARLVRLRQLQQAVSNLPGDRDIVIKLQMVINLLQELFNQTTPQNQPIGRATPRFA